MILRFPNGYSISVFPKGFSMRRPYLEKTSINWIKMPFYHFTMYISTNRDSANWRPAQVLKKSNFLKYAKATIVEFLSNL